MTDKPTCRLWVFPKMDHAAMAREAAEHHCLINPSLDFEQTRQVLLSRLEALQCDPWAKRLEAAALGHSPAI